MRKILLALLVFAVGFTLTATLYGDEPVGTGDVVVHFHKWDEDYEGIGAHAWGSTAAAMPEPTGRDEFGIYFEFKDVAVGAEVGFIAVYFNGEEPDWDRKLTGDVNIDPSAVVKDEVTHVYVFEGAETKEDVPAHYIAKKDVYNLLLVYVDPANNYEENLGVHAWGGWDFSPEWPTPEKVFTNGGSHSAVAVIKAGMLYSESPGAGLLIYAGDDDTKKTGDVKLDDALGENPVLGDVGFAYVVNKGDGYTVGDNVFYDATDFAEEAFKFKLMPMQLDEQTREIKGTYAKDPKTVMVNISSPIKSPYLAAKDKEAAREIIKSWFTVHEILGENEFGPKIPIEDVHFAESAETLINFVLILENPLDNTKEYEVIFDSSMVLDEVEAILVFNVTLDKPLEEGQQINIPGGLSGWDPAHKDFVMEKVDDLNYIFEFEITLKEGENYRTEYKYVNDGTWDGEERLTENRYVIVGRNDIVDGKVNIYDEITFDPEKDENEPNHFNEPYISPNYYSNLVLDLDREAPEIVFISPSGIVGKEEAERIIIVPWGKKFNMNLFPRYEALDDRDGDITRAVFVPKGEFSILDTSEVGDYVIMLEVEDAWGNVTQEKFTFRVQKGK